MGLVSVFGNDVDTFYNTLLERESGSSLIHRFDASPFFCKICWSDIMTAVLMTVGGTCLVAGKRALEDANLGTEILESMDRSKIGVLVETGMGGLTAFSSGFESLLQKGSKKITPGEADIMVVGVIEAAIIPIGVGGFIACRALSQKNGEPQKASRLWDRDRDGFVMGEGSDSLGVSSCINKSLEEAGGSPEEVNYINAHATSTLAGDLAEVNAIKKVFKNTSEIKMNGTKNLESDVTIDTVPNVKKQHEVHVGISNSFGFSGDNSGVVFALFNP
ncbi:hypothetical protein MKW92_018482 [Papaver armeniacum]|nr:hypothetical protein MKW92_018482 [Papaver armeniacum]